MNFTRLAIKHHNKMWIFLFAVISGSFVTGMTGYVTMGTNYPVVLILSVMINYLLGQILFKDKDKNTPEIFSKVIHLFQGKSGQFFANFAGMIILTILLFITIGESEKGAYAFRALTIPDMDLKYYMITLGFLALLPALLGARRNFQSIFFLFLGIISLRAFFILIAMMNASDLPAWNIDNLYYGFNFQDLMGRSGMINISFRLVFWSLIAIELFTFWKKLGYREVKKIKYLVVATFVLILTMVPGIYLAGLYPAELWQLIVNGDEGCYGQCASLALGSNMGGEIGMYFMGLSEIARHMLMMSICFLLISRIITFLSEKGMFFRQLNAMRNYPRNIDEPNEYALIVTFFLTVILSFLNQESGLWIGLGLYMAFGFLLLVQGVCLLNLQFKWFDHSFLGNKTLCVLTVLSVIMMGILFYSGFKGQHLHYLNYSIPIFCFSLWVAATSLVYVMKFKEVEE